MKNLNVRQKTIKILEDDTGSNLFDISHNNFLLDSVEFLERKSNSQETTTQRNNNLHIIVNTWGINFYWGFIQLNVYWTFMIFYIMF